MFHDLETALAKLHENRPELIEAFQKLHIVVTEEGALDAKTKQLMMVAVSTAIRCEPCLRLHVRTALELGATREEILEACSVAVLMGGGPSIAYTALYAMDELERYSQKKEGKT